MFRQSGLGCPEYGNVNGDCCPQHCHPAVSSGGVLPFCQWAEGAPRCLAHRYDILLSHRATELRVWKQTQGREWESEKPLKSSLCLSSLQPKRLPVCLGKSTGSGLRIHFPQPFGSLLSGQGTASHLAIISQVFPLSALDPL